MKSFISILSFQTSSCSGENLAGGLLAVSDERIWFKASDFKLDIAKQLCGKDYETMLKQIIHLIENRIHNPSKESVALFSADYITYLNRYSQGVLQFGAPKPVGLPIDDDSFNILYKKFIGERPLEIA
ncbi:hypothetical protein [Dyadobacter sp. NIV53]|uniref:hypothetical protein n=1 Tax=Dyadobacter sp. NIV53 TaxID=2861765 RepID=UPI001C86B884|nr:hypothetical protein [Dyadobacter sp. NIV53]